MISKKKAMKCKTHHGGCDCWRHQYDKMESALQIIATWCHFEPEYGHTSFKEIEDKCLKALKTGENE